MAFPTVTGVHLLPSTGEFAYDTISAVGFQRGSSGLDNATILNFFSSSPGQPTDYTNAIEQFQIDHPGMQNGQPCHRLVLQFCRCVDLSCLSVDQLHSRRVRAVGGRGLCAGQLDGVWPNRAGFPRPNPAPFAARVNQFRVRRYAKRSQCCPMHPRSQEPWIQCRLLSIFARHSERVSMARTHHFAGRSKPNGDE